jgi:hypothetical protein
MKRLVFSLITAIGKRIEKKRFSDAPIYIGGCGRSGTTLLLSILSAHKEIFACQKELYLFEGEEILENELTTPKFYRLYRTFIQKRILLTAKRYCEKSPSNILFIPMLEKIHDDNFKFIHIVRDGRDVILSRHPLDKNNYWVTPERWIHDVSTGLQYSRHPNLYLLRYEDLVSNFKASIEEICKFLEIPLSNEILQWHKYACVRQSRALFNEIEEINTKSIGKWKEEINKPRVQELLDQPKAVLLLKELSYL